MASVAKTGSRDKSGGSKPQICKVCGKLDTLTNVKSCSSTGKSSFVKMCTNCLTS